MSQQLDREKNLNIGELARLRRVMREEVSVDMHFVVCTVSLLARKESTPTTPSIAPFGVAKSVPLKCVPSVPKNQWVRWLGQTQCVRSASLTSFAPSARRPCLLKPTTVRGAKPVHIRHAAAAAARRARV